MAGILCYSVLRLNYSMDDPRRRSFVPVYIYL
jgi:hypothetical protein